jgi:hypothetical protein
MLREATTIINASGAKCFNACAPSLNRGQIVFVWLPAQNSALQLYRCMDFGRAAPTWLEKNRNQQTLK